LNGAKTKLSLKPTKNKIFSPFFFFRGHFSLKLLKKVLSKTLAQKKKTCAKRKN
jgi:hypothetical protein